MSTSVAETLGSTRGGRPHNGSSSSGSSRSIAGVNESASSCEHLCSALRSEAAEPLLVEAQRRWAARPIAQRLEVIRAARHGMAAHAGAFAEAMSPALQRSGADTLVSELLPLLEAMRFLERRAQKILAPRHLGRTGRPLWLAGVQAEVQRTALGHVLVIGPANFPLFLPGVQALQALTAGNAVTWKPGAGGHRVALMVAYALRESGLPRGVLCVTDESVDAAQNALAQHPDKVVFTGSASSGRSVLRHLAETATPAVMELSGADAAVVLPSADLPLAAKAIAFGLRLNGAEVCMSPRRLIATRGTLQALRPLLEAELANVAPTHLRERTATELKRLIDSAVANGAHLRGGFQPEVQRPLLLEDVQPAMAIARSDIFAPVLSLIEAPSVMHIPDMVNDCPYALTAAVFGTLREARAVGDQLRVGTVLINDLIAPTADPRVPFAGRGQSGFGATRGAEGLLEMTAIKTVLIRRKGSTRHYEPVGAREMPLFSGLIGALHGGSLGERWRAVQQVITAGRGR